MAGFLDWAFRDRATGRIVVGQWPNPALAVAGAAWLASRLAEPGGELARGARWAAASALLVWALDELLRGVNPWRRFLGAAALAFLAAAVLP